LGLAKTQVLPPGFIRDSSTYDNITLAPLNGYVTSDTVVVEVGARYIARSRVVCTVPNVPEYAKLEILSVDTLARVVTFKILADNNCGYRGLAPGVPTG
jgi:hypothetical protein